ncbi:MAG: phosphoribosyltransferase family protein [Thermoanaerobaculia bacterium]
MGRLRSRAPSVTTRLRELLAWWLLPAPCLACDGLQDTLDRALGLCPGCRGALRRVRGPRCRWCLRALPPGGAAGIDACGACLLRRPPHERLLAGWSYEPPFDAVVRALKFGRQLHLGRPIGRRLARELAPGWPAVECIVPVPLHWRRRLARGYNQSAEIAAGIADETGLPLRPLLRRRKATRRQARLPFEERAANVRGAFRIRVRTPLPAGRYLLVDDVVTTGGTLEQASAALRAAGATSVLCVAAARTPHTARPKPE